MPSPPSRPTVLVVEDDPAHAEIVRRRIDRLDGPACEVVACGRLADALEYAGESPPDLVLLDLRLPDSDTAETLDRISAFTARGARVVVLSALCTPELAAAAIAAGAADFVEKGHLDEEVLTRLVAGGDASPSATPPPAADAALPEFDLRELSARFTHDANSWLTILSVRIGSLAANLTSDDAGLHIDALRQSTDALVALVAAGRALVVDESTPVDVGPIAIERRAAAVAVEGVEVTPPSAPTLVRGCAYGVDIVLDALARNAADASGGESRRLDLRPGPREDGHVAIDVVDDGGAWDVVNASRLGEPFMAGLPGSTHAGVGLYRSRRWMERMGGSLDVLPRDDVEGAYLVRLTFEANP